MGSRPNFKRLIDGICEENGLSIASFSDNWGMIISSGDKRCIIVGYNFPLNKASSKELCQDKALTYDVLSACKIPAVPHIFLYKTGENEERNLSECCTFLEKYGEIVIKDNQGTGGHRVFRTKSLLEAENILTKIHEISYGASLSPFLQISAEYRVVMLLGQPRVVIRKERESVTGDGVNSVRRLIEKSGKVFKTLPEEDRMNYVPKAAEKVYLNWKHNLGQGAEGIIEENPLILGKVHEIAKQAVKALDMEFCSVDIVETEDGFFVLEVNAGVMLEHFSGQNDRCFEVAKEIYRDAIFTGLNEKR